MKVCPLRMHALENNLENVQNFGSALDIMDHGRDDEIEATIGCLKEHCAWWAGDYCTVLIIPEALFGIKVALETLDLTIYQKE